MTWHYKTKQRAEVAADRNDDADATAYNVACEYIREADLLRLLQDYRLAIPHGMTEMHSLTTLRLDMLRGCA